MAGLFGDLNVDPLTLGLFGMAAGFGSAPRGLGPTLGGGFGGLAQGLSLGQQMQMRQAEMDYKRTQEARAQQELDMKKRQQEQQENFWRNFTGVGASPTGLPAAPTTSAPAAAPSGGFVDRMVGLESGGDPNARPTFADGTPRSSALGPGQFINGTWLDLLRRRKPELASARNDEFLLSLRADPALSREMVAAYAEENGAKLAAAGLPDNDTTRALAHRFGPQGAIQVLSAPPGTPIASVVGDQVMKANPDLAGKTAGSVVGWYAQRMGGAAPQPGAQSEAAPAASGSDPYARARALMARAEYLAMGEAQGLVKPGLAAQYRAAAEMELKPLSDPVERVTDAQGRVRIIPRAQAVGATSYGDAPSGYQWQTDARGNVVGLKPLQGGPAEFIIQEVQGPKGQLMRYAIPRASLTAAPGAAPVPGQQGNAAPVAAPTTLAQAPVNLQAPGTPPPSWAPSGGVLLPPDARSAAVPPGSIALGAAGKPDNNPAGLEPGTKKDVEAALLESQNALSGMNRVRDQFRPEYLQTTTRLGNWWSSVRDRTPEIFGKLDAKQQSELQDFTKFRAAAWNDLNTIIKDQSGAAVTVPEMERMLRARPNPGTGVFDGDSPTEFKAKMDEVLAMKQNAVLRNAWALRRGINPLESGVTLDQVPKLMADMLNTEAAKIAKAQPDLSAEEVKAMARRSVGQFLGLGALR